MHPSNPRGSSSATIAIALLVAAGTTFAMPRQDDPAGTESAPQVEGRAVESPAVPWPVRLGQRVAALELRLPVVEKGRLLGQVSRRDVLRGMEEMSRKRLVRRRRYPDYLQPA